MKAETNTLNYGMGAKALSRRINCTKEEAEKLMATYMATYPAVKAFFDEAVKQARDIGYNYTVLGRRRYLPAIHSYRKMDRLRAERQAGNLEIQGSAADVINAAMLKIDESKIDELYDCQMLFQVHDELVFEVPEEHVDVCKGVIQQCMEHAFPTDLPVLMAAKPSSGANWGEAK